MVFWKPTNKTFQMIHNSSFRRLPSLPISHSPSRLEDISVLVSFSKARPNPIREIPNCMFDLGVTSCFEMLLRIS